MCRQRLLKFCLENLPPERAEELNKSAKESIVGFGDNEQIKTYLSSLEDEVINQKGADLLQHLPAEQNGVVLVTSIKESGRQTIFSEGNRTPELKNNARLNEHNENSIEKLSREQRPQKVICKSFEQKGASAKTKKLCSVVKVTSVETTNPCTPIQPQTKPSSPSNLSNTGCRKELRFSVRNQINKKQIVNRIIEKKAKYQNK